MIHRTKQRLESLIDDYAALCLALALVILSLIGVGDVRMTGMTGILLCGAGMSRDSAQVDLRILIPLIIYDLAAMASSYVTYGNIVDGYGAMHALFPVSCNPNQQWAASTEQGDDVIILRYVREAPEDPETPPEEPENPPDDPETPPDDPRKPLRDPERPSRNSRRSSESRENSAEITSLEEGVPSTGDNSRIVLWAVLAAGLLCGLTVWRFHFRKRTNP
ncbi:MAG: hypothetical protein HFI16_11095 [Lachnospiraceae bacterium]|nr:hypothetical protein [Lachnospiraceae bacterium]